MVPQEDMQRLKDRIIQGIEAETSVIQCHKWLINTTNYDLPLIDILSDDKKELKLLTNEMKILLGKISIHQVLVNDTTIVPIEEQKLEIESRILIIISMFTPRKYEVLAEYGSTAATCTHIGMRHGIQLSTTKNYCFYDVTNLLELSAGVQRTFLTELNMVNLTVDLDFHLIFSAHGSFSLMKLKVVVLELLSSVSAMIH